MEESNKDTIIIINDTSSSTTTHLVKKYESDKNIDYIMINEIKNEIIDLKKDIHEIKNVMKEMAVLMKSIYLFEYQTQIKD